MDMSVKPRGKRSSKALVGDTPSQLPPSYINSHLPLHSSSQLQVTSSTTPYDFTESVCNPPWLTASKGDIKKFAQTLFANSSPISYRAMPASVESSEFDKTSFVEKSFIHKIIFPVSYYLEVAKLWALSKRSELECRFTVAQSDQKPKNLSDFKQEFEKRQRPISHAGLASHSSVPLSHEDLHNVLNEKSTAEEDLLRSVNRFMECCRLKDKSLSNSESDDLTHGVGSETRRYLSQIMSLMNENFAKKLVKEHGLRGKSNDCLMPRKRTSVSRDYPDVAVSSPRVKVITMSPVEEQKSDNKEQFVIIHIPKRKKSGDDAYSEDDKCLQEDEANEKSVCENLEPMNNEEMDVDEECEKPAEVTSREEAVETTQNTDACWSQPSLPCFYCQLTFPDEKARARHMLTHLTSKIETET